MNETVIVLKITHRKDLPPLVTDAIAQRAYGWLYSHGVEAGVTAALVEIPQEPGSLPLPVREMGQQKGGE